MYIIEYASKIVIVRDWLHENYSIVCYIVCLAEEEILVEQMRDGMLKKHSLPRSELGVVLEIFTGVYLF